MIQAATKGECIPRRTFRPKKYWCPELSRARDTTEPQRDKWAAHQVNTKNQRRSDLGHAAPIFEKTERCGVNRRGMD